MPTGQMSTVITKSSPVVVRPATSLATPTPERIKLSSFDKALAFCPFTSFLVFEHAIHEPAETVRNALSRALVHYFPIAGRAVVGADDGELLISCTGEGVLFVSASVNCSLLQDVKLFDPPFDKLLKDLAVIYPEETCRELDPLLLVQVTEFSCGGYVIGITWNHALADGTGMAQFLQAVGDLARGLPLPSVLPVSCADDSLPELPPMVTFIEKMMVTLQPQGLVNQDITVPSKLVDRIRSEFAATAAAAGHGDDDPCTVYEAVVAVLWQCRTRVVMSDPNATAPLVFAANVRKHVGAREGYYGNCVTSAVTVPRSGEVANGDIKDVVKLIKRAKQALPVQFIKNNNVANNNDEEGGGLHGQADYSSAPTEIEQLADVLFGYNAFYVSSWRNLGFDAAYMGGGTPVRVLCHVELTAVPNCVACLPCGGKDGTNMLALCVRDEHVDAFVGALQNFDM